jgi:hypothetical protein
MMDFVFLAQIKIKSIAGIIHYRNFIDSSAVCVFSAPQLVHGGGSIDFLVFDYLSEITMSLLALAQRKSPVRCEYP